MASIDSHGSRSASGSTDDEIGKEIDLHRILSGEEKLESNSNGAFENLQDAVEFMREAQDVVDDLSGDLLGIIESAKLDAGLNMVQTGNPDQTITFDNSLTERLTVYIVNRDHKILQHGIELGRKKNA